MGTMDSFPRGRRATCEARADIMNEWIHTTPPLYVFVAQTDNLLSVLNGRTHNFSVIKLPLSTPWGHIVEA